VSTLSLSRAQLIAFILQDTDGSEVTGLAGTFSVAISKDGGAFAAGSGVKAEIGSGWYSYDLTAAETDTPGPLAIKITGAGADQQNLLYQVSGSVWESPAGTNILTTEEAAAVLRCAEDDNNMLMLLPQIDAYIEHATGRNWAADTTVRQEAKSAARMLLVRWHEDPGGMAAGSSLGFGLTATLVQLEALALTLETAGVPDEALALAASIPESSATEIAVTITPVLVFNHEMDEDAEDAVSLEDADGNVVAATAALDVTGRILTITPGEDLEVEASYTLIIDAAPDIYGQTLSTEIGFSTA